MRSGPRGHISTIVWASTWNGLSDRPTFDLRGCQHSGIEICKRLCEQHENAATWPSDAVWVDAASDVTRCIQNRLEFGNALNL